jgi:hypothetical protein
VEVSVPLAALSERTNIHNLGTGAERHLGSGFGSIWICLVRFLKIWYWIPLFWYLVNLGVKKTASSDGKQQATDSQSQSQQIQSSNVISID